MKQPKINTYTSKSNITNDWNKVDHIMNSNKKLTYTPSIPTNLHFFSIRKIVVAWYSKIESKVTVTIRWYQDIFFYQNHKTVPLDKYNAWAKETNHKLLKHQPTFSRKTIQTCLKRIQKEPIQFIQGGAWGKWLNEFPLEDISAILNHPRWCCKDSTIPYSK